MYMINVSIPSAYKFLPVGFPYDCSNAATGVECLSIASVSVAIGLLKNGLEWTPRTKRFTKTFSVFAYYRSSTSPHLFYRTSGRLSAEELR